MLHLLVTTDFSSTAFNAFKYATQLCQQFKGKITVLHSYAKLTKSKSGSGELELRKEKEKFEKEISKMLEFLELAQLNVSVDFIFKEGELLHNVHQLLNTTSYDCIVMGTTGNSGYENKILGTTTRSIIDNVVIPVLSVPVNARFDEIDTIGFTTVYDEQDQHILKKIIPIAKQYKSDIICIHVKNEKDKNINERKESFKKNFESEPVIFIEKENKNVENGIFEFIDQSSVDLICAVTRTRSFWKKVFEKSLTERLGFHQSIPVLVFHEDYLKE